MTNKLKDIVLNYNLNVNLISQNSLITVNDHFDALIYKEQLQKFLCLEK